jgi:hypothetical protein
MNRIILIGNGFDLAHGLKTSYHNFIDDFWEETVKEIKDLPRGKPFSNELFDIKIIPHFWRIENTYDGLLNSLKDSSSKIILKNNFLQHITEKKGIQNWVDIENEYYSLLKNSYQIKQNNYKISQLNKDFKEVTLLLEKYLSKIENEFNTSFSNEDLRKEIGYKIYGYFNLKDFTESSINEKVEQEYNRIKGDMGNLRENQVDFNELDNHSQMLINRIGNQEPKKVIRKLLMENGAVNYFDLNPKSILFLNFNYTSTEKLYLNHKEFEPYHEFKDLNKEIIHIHGLINKKENEIIFGFGDEIDSDYHEIEKLNENEYLENIKSIKYLETDNYKKVLEFLNGSGYQVLIFGHSCGLSDRTLLSTLFNHKNCHSIKLYYHQKDNENDNYSDIIRNISRNFTDKSLMRDKVVNKMYCEPLKKFK